VVTRGIVQILLNTFEYSVTLVVYSVYSESTVVYSVVRVYRELSNAPLRKCNSGASTLVTLPRSQQRGLIVCIVCIVYSLLECVVQSFVG